MCSRRQQGDSSSAIFYSGEHKGHRSRAYCRSRYHRVHDKPCRVDCPTDLTASRRPWAKTTRRRAAPLHGDRTSQHGISNRRRRETSSSSDTARKRASRERGTRPRPNGASRGEGTPASTGRKSSNRSASPSRSSPSWELVDFSGTWYLQNLWNLPKCATPSGAFGSFRCRRISDSTAARKDRRPEWRELRREGEWTPFRRTWPSGLRNQRT